jgi:hypothetical protein
MGEPQPMRRAPLTQPGEGRPGGGHRAVNGGTEPLGGQRSDLARQQSPTFSPSSVLAIPHLELRRGKVVTKDGGCHRGPAH